MRALGAALLLCVPVWLGGCGPSPQEFFSVETAAEDVSGYPLSIENYDGYAGNGALISQTFLKPPERIVAASEPTIDNLIFLGLEDKIAGISDMAGKAHTDYDEIYGRLKRLNAFGGYPSREQVVAARPDIIIGWGSLFNEKALGSVKEWHARGIHTYVMKNTVPTRATGNRKVRYFLEDLENLAEIFHIQEESKPKIDALRKRIDALESWSGEIPDEKRPTVKTVQYVRGNQYSARTSADLTADIIRLSGGKSIDGPVGGRQSVEFLLRDNPDILLIVDMPRADISAEKKIRAMMENPVLQSVKAVREKNFLVIDYNAFYCGSFRTVEAAEHLRHLVKEKIENEKE